MPGTLFVVATPIGNLEDVTVRALRVLREVALIAAEDTRRTAHLLARHGITTPTTSLHEHNEARKSPALVQRLLSGESMALVSDAGTPTVSDPGAHLIRLAIETGIRVEPLPGPSAAIAALSVAGLSTESFLFMGFPPTRGQDRQAWFGRVANSDTAVVFFEAPHRIRTSLEQLRQSVGDVPIVVTRELTKAHEQLVRGQISDVLQQLETERGEYTVIADVRHLPNFVVKSPPTPEQLATEFGELTKTLASSRRRVVSVLAKKHGLKANDVYEALETRRKSGA
jgi:16S rRNA (cytidine1402-2'-O)-methyltransferase